MDFAAAGLLDGLEGDERRARQELLERLAADGVSLDELRAAVAEDRLVLLPVERVLGGSLTPAEIATRSGVPEETLIALWRALGFPEPQAGETGLSDDDLAAAQSLKVILDAGIPRQSVLEIARVLGEGSSRLASTIASAFADTYLEPGDTERDVALRYAAMARQLLPLLSPMLSAALAAHVREAARRGIISRAERERGRLAVEDEMVVCFADLVGFTNLGNAIGAEELGTVARGLAELAAAVATQTVRLVKTIGDAAMFVSPDPAGMVRAALELIDAAAEADLPSLRAGVASGPVLNRAGDWYGHSVNLASRVTGVARPGSVLCTEDVHEAAADEFSWSFAGRFRLKGVDGAVPLYRARQPEEAEPPRSDRRDRARKPRADRPQTRAPR
jgi:adenylate cyclase